MKTYRQHRCNSNHRTFVKFIECAIGRRRLAWVAGEGQYALIAWCDVPTVTLYDDIAEAEKQKSIIDSTACGHACRRSHEVVRLAK